MLFNAYEPTIDTLGAPAAGAQATVTDILNAKKTTFSAEVIPPRNGAETAVILRQIDAMKREGVDFISVTKGAGGSLRGGTLPIAQLIKTHGICSIAHFTCRDFSIEEVENSLMDHFYFGIRNILALRGDPPDGRLDHFKAAPNRHSYAHQLVTQIKALNEGRYLLRDGFDKGGGDTRPGMATNFCIGVAAYPEEEKGVEYFRVKIDAGAHFGITQMIFQGEPYGQFLDDVSKTGPSIPILPGLRIITSHATAERMIKKFGVKIPAKFVDELARFTNKEDSRKAGIEFTYNLCRELLARGAPGIHLFIMSDDLAACELLKALR